MAVGFSANRAAASALAPGGANLRQAPYMGNTVRLPTTISASGNRHDSSPNGLRQVRNSGNSGVRCAVSVPSGPRYSPSSSRETEGARYPGVSGLKKRFSSGWAKPPAANARRRTSASRKTAYADLMNGVFSGLNVIRHIASGTPMVSVASPSERMSRTARQRAKRVPRRAGSSALRTCLA